MPTTRPRHQITETPEVAHALDAAEARWPGEPRSRLIVRLIVDNGAAVEAENEDAAKRRRDAVDALAGTFDDVYEEGFREGLRDEWPA